MQAQKTTILIFSQNLRNSMEASCLTQKALAEKIGVSQAAISKWLNGSIPRADQLALAATALGVSMEWLLIGEPDPNPADPNRLKFRQPNKAAIRKALESAKQSLARLESELDSDP
jgi:transcriptional regulator with XRE-family HTH domain